MSESGNNIHSNQGNGASLPNGTNPNNNTNSTNNTTPMTGNNITVSIEYMYETPNISATQNNSNNNNNNSNNNNNTNNAGSTRPTNSTSESPHSETTTSQHSQPQQQPPPGGMRPFPPGVVFLQFRDIPAGNTQERLQTIMNIASEIAVRRIVDLSNVRYNRGITKEKFESLPVIPIKELDPTVKEDGCSICYEPFVDSIPDIVSDENKKRNRDDDDNEKEGSENNRRKKKLRSDSSDGDDNNNNNSNNIDTSPINNLSANIGDVNSGETSTENTTTNTNNSEAQITNDEETNPTYDHSAVKAPCGHIFGRECLYKWCKSENTCPLCRQVIAESVNTPIAVDPAQAAATTNAAFQRIHDLLYNTNNVNNNSNSTEDNNGNIPVATNGTNNNNSTPSTSNQQSTTTATASTTVIPTPSTTTTSTTNVPFRTSNIVFITPQWYIPPNTTSTTATATATASASAGSGNTTVSDGNTSRSENNETQTANDTSDNNLNQNERPSPYERFRTIIGSYFDGLINQNNYSNNNTNNTNSSESPSNDPTVNGNRITNTNSTFSATPGNVQNATRNLDLLAMGNSIRNALLQQRNVLSGTYNNGDTPTLFNSGVASYRTSSGNVSTYHLGAHEVFHASNNNRNNNTTVGSTSTDNQNGDNNDSSHSSSGGDGTSLRNNEQEENNSNNNYTNTSTS